MARQILGFNWTLVAKCKGQVCEADSRGSRTRKLGKRGMGPTPRPRPRPRPRAHCVCRCGPPSHPGRCRRRSPRCPHRCPHSRRGWAGSCCSWLQGRRRRGRRRKRGDFIWAGQTGGSTPRLQPRQQGADTASVPSGLLTDGAGAALPARGAGAAEGVATVVARATVAAGVGITLELTCGHTAAQGAPGAVGGIPAGSPQRSRGSRALTRVAGLALPTIVTRAIEVVDQVVATAAAVAGIGKAVVGIWG